MNTDCACCVLYNSFFDSQKIEAIIDKLLRVLLVKADYFFIVSHDKKNERLITKTGRVVHGGLYFWGRSGTYIGVILLECRNFSNFVIL